MITAPVDMISSTIWLLTLPAPNGFLRVVPNAMEDRLVQPLASVTETIVRAFVGSRDESVEGH